MNMFSELNGTPQKQQVIESSQIENDDVWDLSNEIGNESEINVNLNFGYEIIMGIIEILYCKIFV